MKTSFISLKQDLFRLPCLIAHVPEWKDVKRDFLSTVNWQDPDCQLDHCYSDYFRYFCQGEKPPYHMDLMKILEGPLDFFANENPGATVMSSWCQRYGANQMHPVHTHGVIGYSAVFYAQLGQAHKPTCFFAPFPDPWTGFIDETIPKCEEGDIIFFPSQVMHQSLPHAAAEDRIIFSFNIMQSPESIYV